MRRTVYLGEQPAPAPAPGCMVLTPNENAAKALGAYPIALEGLAREELGGERIAHPLLVGRFLRRAVAETISTDDPAGIARSLLPIVRELFRANADLQTAAGSGRASRVLAVALCYRKLLRQQGLIDPAETLHEAARRAPQRRPVHVYGYARLGASEVAFLDAVAGDGSVLSLPYADDPLFDENLETAGVLEKRGWSVRRAPDPEIWSTSAPVAAHSYAHLEAEVRGVLAQVKAMLVDGVSKDDLVIVARDDAFYGPTVLSVSREYGVPVQALYQLSLAETRVGDWVGLLLEASADGYPFEPTARLLAHPLGPGIPEEIWPAVRKARPGTAGAWAEAGIALPAEWPHEWPTGDSRAGWLSRFDALLAARHFAEGTKRWHTEAVALMNLKNAAAWLGEPETETLSREDFLVELEELLYLATTPAHPDREGVALHTPLSLFGARYRHAFVLGLAEGSFPASVNDDSVLDFYERRRLREENGIRLESAHERARRERLSFRMLLRVPQERLVLSFPRLTERRPALPSPYFDLLGAEPVLPEPLAAASPEEARRALLQRGGLEDPVLTRAVRAWEVERRREGPAPFDLYDGVTGVPVDLASRTFSVSELMDLARCGFRWWAGSLLRLREPEEGGESPALLGILYHRALENAAERARAQAAGGESIDPARMKNGVLEHLEESFGEAEESLEMHRLRAWAVRRSPHLEMLRRAVESESFAPPGTQTEHLEASFVGDWRGFRVKGRVDRVDRVDGGLAFVDYKTSGSVPDPDLQLAIYREAAGPVLFPGESVGDAYYFNLRAAERISAKQPGEEALERVVGEIRSNLEAGRLPPDSLERDASQAVCRFCAYDLVCRQGPRLDRKLGPRES